MTAVASRQVLVALLPGPDRYVLGLTIRERNARVAARAGARLVEPSALHACGDELALLVSPDTLIDLPLFADPLPGSAVRLGPLSGVLAGPASALAAFTGGRTDASALSHLQVRDGALLDGATAGARRRAGWSILQRTAKPTDGWIARHFNRPISRPVSYALLTMKLRADHASVLTLLVGVAAALVATTPGSLPFLITGLLFHLASVLDGVDGEMARATFTESERGAQLDAVVDQVTYVICFFGIVVGWGREGLGPPVVLWGAGIAAALVLSLLRGARFVSRYAPNASFVFIDRSVRRAARESGRWPLRATAAAFLFLRRDLFAIVFLGASLTGRRVLVPALVVGGIVLANITLSRYRRELEAAALLENPPRRRGSE